MVRNSFPSRFLYDDDRIRASLTKFASGGRLRNLLFWEYSVKRLLWQLRCYPLIELVHANFLNRHTMGLGGLYEKI